MAEADMAEADGITEPTVPAGKSELNGLPPPQGTAPQGTAWNKTRRR